MALDKGYFFNLDLKSKYPVAPFLGEPYLNHSDYNN